MRRILETRLIGWVIALAMIVVGAAVPASPSLAHDRVQHVEIVDDHGHSHGLDEVEIAPSGDHKHSPHASDHTHDVPGLPPVVTADIRRALADSEASMPQDAPRNLPVTLDRPPKSSANA